MNLTSSYLGTCPCTAVSSEGFPVSDVAYVVDLFSDQMLLTSHFKHHDMWKHKIGYHIHCVLR